MKTKRQKRSSYLSGSGIPLGQKTIKIWGYDKTETFVCRLEINAAGLEVFSGVRGGKSFGNWSGETLVKNLKRKTRQ
jgi:hypothetical protein